MRTTITLDDDVYQAVATLSQTSGLSFGKILSKAAREGLKPNPVKTNKRPFPTFEISKNAPLIPGDLVQKIWENEGLG